MISAILQIESPLTRLPIPHLRLPQNRSLMAVNNRGRKAEINRRRSFVSTPHESLHITMFGVRRSARYHERRRAFFEGVNTTILFLQVAAGSLAVGTWIKSADSEAGLIALAGLAGLLAAVNLVVGTQRKATLHSSLAQQFLRLERDMLPFEADRDISSDKVTEFQQARIELEETEPPKLRVIDLLCHNELVMGVSAYRNGKNLRRASLEKMAWACIGFGCTAHLGIP